MDKRICPSNGIGKGIASLAVMAGGVYCMWLTGGKTGIGWAIFGLLLIWG